MYVCFDHPSINCICVTVGAQSELVRARAFFSERAALVKQKPKTDTSALKKAEEAAIRAEADAAAAAAEAGAVVDPEVDPKLKPELEPNPESAFCPLLANTWIPVQTLT